MITDYETWRQERIRTRQFNMTAGAILGMALSATLILLFLTQKTLTSWSVVFTGITFAGAAWSVRAARGKLAWLFFPKALSVGLSTVIYASLFVFVTWYAYITLFDPGFIGQFIEQTEYSLTQLIPATTAAEEAEQMRQAIAASMEEARANTTPASYAVGQACNTVVWGALAALIAALFYKESRKKIFLTIRKTAQDTPQPSADEEGQDLSQQ
ncbi:MAG: DUF4199 domain-containing protein [Bacteroidales bacterium]|nr:DUF4199 domain-containing protein [Bacteroidales bacterium]